MLDLWLIYGNYSERLTVCVFLTQITQHLNTQVIRLTFPQNEYSSHFYQSTQSVSHQDSV